MRSWTPAEGIACYLVVPPSYRPQSFLAMLHSGDGDMLCFPAHSARPNRAEIPLLNGELDIYQRGNDRHDIALELTAASDETQNAIEEIVRRGIPVLVYPRAEGTVQSSLPLIRGTGIDGDGDEVTHTLTLATGTLLYLPHPDTSRMVYLERIADGALPLLNEIPTTAVKESIQNPLGRGLFMPATAKNLLKNSNLGNVAYEAPLPIDGWRWINGGDTWGTHAGTIDSPWHDGKAYWTRSENNYLSSPKFDLTASTDKQILFSACYRVSGSIVVQIYDSAGHELHGAVTITHGTGRVQWPIPIITGATETNCTLRITLGSGGEFGMIGAPQLISNSPDAIGDYLPYLGSETDVQGEITASSLKVEGSWGMDCAPYNGDGSTWDGYLCVGGYIQPGYQIAYRADKTIAFLEKYLGASAGDVELRFRPAGNFYEAALYSGGTRRAGSAIGNAEAPPRRGEAYAWVLYTGRENGALRCGAYIRDLASETETAITWTGGGIGYATRLFLGSRSTAGYGADSLLSGVTISSAKSLTEVRTICARMAAKENIYLFRRTAGRHYRLSYQVKPRRFDTGWEGTLTGLEVKAI